MHSVNLTDLGPLYYNYSLLGAQNTQRGGMYALNQLCMERIIVAYILQSLAKCSTTTSSHVSFTELFCAEGYYTMLARRFGAYVSIGVDNGRDLFFSKAPIIAKRLGLTRVKFIKADVDNAEALMPTDIVANVGGLYHVQNPEEILCKSYNLAKQYLIIQSVVSMATDSPTYFETPAPGWSWGSRYSRQSFDAMIRSKGWNILDSHWNELEGSPDPKDRGSVYYLVKKEA